MRLHGRYAFFGWTDEYAPLLQADVSIFRFTPESVRWLVSQGRVGEADAVVARVGAMNNVPVKETFADVARDPSTHRGEDPGSLEVRRTRCRGPVTGPAFNTNITVHCQLWYVWH